MQVTYMYTDYGLVVITTKSTELNGLTQEVTKDCVSLHSLFFHSKLPANVIVTSGEGLHCSFVYTTGHFTAFT